MSHTNQIQNILHRHTLWLYYFNRLNTAHRNDQKTLNCFRLSSQCASSETHSKDLGKGFSFRQLIINLVFNLFSTELQCYINFFSQGTIQIMRDKKAWFFLVKVDKNVIKALYGKVSQYCTSTCTWGARVSQWWEHSPPTNVARVWILVSTPLCGLSLLFVLSLIVLRGFSFSLKTNTSKFQFNLESRHVSTSSHELLSAPQLTNYNYNVPVACLLVCWVTPATETNLSSHCLYKEKKMLK